MADTLVYYLLYKPFQVLTQFSRVPGKQTLADIIDVPKDVYPVGRLDYDSEGLLLLTNDKSLNQQVLTPGKAHEREYWVQVEGSVSPEALVWLQRGVIISLDGKKHQTLPAKAMVITTQINHLPTRQPPIRFRKDKPTSWVSLTLQEGKNRQVRRMTAAVGFPTLRLVRWRIGRQNAAGMLPGDLRTVKKRELL